MPNLLETFAAAWRFAIRNRCLAFCLLALAGGNLASAQQLPALTNAAAVRLLPADEARKGYPVRLRGIVTYTSAAWGTFLQDDTGGVYVWPPLTNGNVRAGLVLELEGKTDPGKYSSFIFQSASRIAGEGSFPAARSVTLEQALTGREDSQWTEIEGTVHAAWIDQGQNYVRLGTPTGRALVIFGGERSLGELERLVDTHVKVRGVCSVGAGDNRELASVNWLSPDFSHLEVLGRGAAAPFELPTNSIASLRGFRSPGPASHRRRVQGTVTLFKAAKALFIADSTAGMYIYAPPKAALVPGDKVDVVGFPVWNATTAEMQEALVRKIGSGPPPEPRKVRVSGAIIEGLDGRLVTLTGRLTDMVSGTEERLLVLQTEDAVFDAAFSTAREEKGLPSFKPGSLLQVTGICSIFKDRGDLPRGLRVYVRSFSDVRLLRGPPWWTPLRVQYLLGFIAIGSLAAVLRFGVLNRRVRMQAANLEAQHEREKALQIRYRDLFENAAEIVCTLDWSGRFATINRASERISGRKQSEIIGQSFRAFMTERQARRLYRAFRSVLRGKAIGALEIEILGEDNRTVPLEISLQITRSPGRGPDGVQVIARGIAERKAAEVALRQSEELFFRAFHFSPVSMSITSKATGKFIDINDRFTQHFGHTREEAIGKTALELNIWEDPSDRAAVLERIDAGKPVRNCEFRFRSRSGELRSGLTSAEAIEVASEARLLWIFHDMTERVRLEMELRQAQKMESIGQLAAGVAHDFNNMLTVIQGHADLLLSRAGHDCEMAESLREISLGGERAANLTRQLLTFSRKQPIQPALLGLNEVIEELARLLRRTLGEHIELRFRPAPNLPAVFADKGMMEQVATNLAVNARDAMPKGGVLEIATGAGEYSPPPGAPAEARAGRFVFIRVTDNGCGMSQATLDRVFEPFFTTKEVGKGTGLGLATVYGIARQHNGWVEARSEVGRGSAFTVFLPAAAESPPSEPASAPASAAPGGAETILLVEDEVSLLHLTGRVLERFGYRVLRAGSGPEALALWGGQSSEISLLVTDMVMPGGLSGYDLAEQLQSAKPGLKVIFTTGYSVELHSRPMAETTRFLQKPYGPDVLLKTIRDCLDEPHA